MSEFNPILETDYQITDEKARKFFLGSYNLRVSPNKDKDGNWVDIYGYHCFLVPDIGVIIARHDIHADDLKNQTPRPYAMRKLPLGWDELQPFDPSSIKDGAQNRSLHDLARMAADDVTLIGYSIMNARATTQNPECLEILKDNNIDIIDIFRTVQEANKSV